MVDRETARQLVEKHVNERYTGSNGPLIVVDSSTREKPYGWVFFYCTKLWWETRDIRYLLAGNGPIIFDARTQRIHQLGTATHPDVQIRDWEAENWK